MAIRFGRARDLTVRPKASGGLIVRSGGDMPVTVVQIAAGAVTVPAGEQTTVIGSSGSVQFVQPPAPEQTSAGLDYSHGYVTAFDGVYRYYRWTTENGANYLIRRQDRTSFAEIELERTLADDGPPPADLTDFQGINWS